MLSYGIVPCRAILSACCVSAVWSCATSFELLQPLPCKAAKEAAFDPAGAIVTVVMITIEVMITIDTILTNNTTSTITPYSYINVIHTDQGAFWRAQHVVSQHDVHADVPGLGRHTSSLSLFAKVAGRSKMACQHMQARITQAPLQALTVATRQLGAKASQIIFRSLSRCRCPDQ